MHINSAQSPSAAAAGSDMHPLLHDAPVHDAVPSKSFLFSVL